MIWLLPVTKRMAVVERSNVEEMEEDNNVCHSTICVLLTKVK